jgi:ribosomal protein S10
MLGKIKSSRRELLAAMEGKAPRDLVKRLTLIKDLNQLKSLVKNVRTLESVVDKGRVKHLVSKYKGTQNNKLSSLLQQSAEVQKHLDPLKSQREVLTIRYSSFDRRAHYAGVRLAKACELMGFGFTGPVGLPQKTKRWTLLKSPFKYKKHQESWEKRTIRSIVTIDTEERGHLLPNLIEFLSKTNYTGVEVKIKTRRFISPEQIYTDPYVKENLNYLPALPDVDYGASAIDEPILKEVLAIPAKAKGTKVVETIVKL